METAPPGAKDSSGGRTHLMIHQDFSLALGPENQSSCYGFALVFKQHIFIPFFFFFFTAAIECGPPCRILVKIQIILSPT